MSIIAQACLSGARREGIQPGQALENVWLEIEFMDTGNISVVDIRQDGRSVRRWIPPYRINLSGSSTKNGPIASLKAMGLAYGLETIKKECKNNPVKLKEKIKAAKERMPKFRENFLQHYRDLADSVPYSAPAEAVLKAFEGGKLVERLVRHLHVDTIEDLPVSTLVLFKYDGKYIHEYSHVKKFFDNQILQATPVELEDRQCCITGKTIRFATRDGEAPILDRGWKLCSAKNDRASFQHWGKNSVDNFPKERAVDIQVNSYMKRLISYNCPDPRNQGGNPLPNRSYRLVGGDRVLFWAAEETDERLCEVMTQLPYDHDRSLQAACTEAMDVGNVDNTERVRRIYRSVWKGTPNETDPSGQYYVLVLTEANKRFAITNFLVSSVAKVQFHIAQHFADIILDTGYGSGYVPALGTIMSAVLSESERSAKGGWQAKFPAEVGRQLYLASITGQSYPEVVFQRAVRRCFQENLEPGWAFNARMAFIKAHVNRQIRLGKESHFKEVSQMIDHDNNDIGYLLGRLLAVGSYAQNKAYPGGNSPLRLRFAHSLVASPGLVYKMLLDQIEVYAQTVARTSTGLASYIRSQVIELGDKISGAGGMPNRPMTQPQQVQLMGGYYSEAAEGIRRSRANK
jgi:CRISPR-associated protein Cas8c/Csd1 subtype I-C